MMEQLNSVVTKHYPEKVIKLAPTGAYLWNDSIAIVPSLWENDKKHFDATYPELLKTPKEKTVQVINPIFYLH